MAQYGNYKTELYRKCNSKVRLFGMKYFKDEPIKDDEFYRFIVNTVSFEFFKVDIEFRRLKREILKILKCK